MASELLQLHYPQAGTPVLVMVIFSMIALLAAVFMLSSILNYDTYVNRQTSLLTRTYNMTEFVLLFWVLAIVFANIIILTGTSFNHHVCLGYTLWEYLMGHLYLQCTAMEAVIHYLFFVKSSRFLIIKDDILCTIFWRSAVAVAVASTGRSFMGHNILPRTYHFCTGTAPLEGASPRGLETKCDDNNENSTEQYEMVIFIFYTGTFFIFTFAICWENIRQMKLTSNSHPKRQLVIDNIGFIMKMTCSIMSCFVTLAYDEMDDKNIVTFPGSLIFYCYHLWLVPVCSIAARVRRFWVDEPLCAYVRRVIGCPPRQSGGDANFSVAVSRIRP